MSCPQCGSGAVFKGKCRECGAEVKIHRVTGANPAVGRVPQFGERTNAAPDPRHAPARPAAPSLPLATPQTPPKRAEARASARARAGPSKSEAPVRPPVDEGAVRAASASAAEAPAGEDASPALLDPMAAAAALALRVPSAAPLVDSAPVPAEAAESAGRRGAPVEAGAAAALQALAGALGILAGKQELYAAIGAGIEVALAALLFSRAGFGRALVPAAVAWDFGWAISLAVARDRPVLGPLTALPGLFLLGAFYAKSPALRWGSAALSTAFSIAAQLAV